MRKFVKRGVALATGLGIILSSFGTTRVYGAGLDTSSGPTYEVENDIAGQKLEKTNFNQEILDNDGKGNFQVQISVDENNYDSIEKIKGVYTRICGMMKNCWLSMKQD